MLNPKQILDQFPEACGAILVELESLFHRMDAAYDRVAGAYAFQCRGCEDNCCKTRFYHHTVLELLCLCRGFAALSGRDRAGAARRAAAAVAPTADADAGGRPGRTWCPLNTDGRCLLYACRPMICRLHGIPHALDHPVRGVIHGPGCDEFHRAPVVPVRSRLDRTPFYRRMAGLEAKLKQAVGFDGKIKLTVAEMILLF